MILEDLGIGFYRKVKVKCELCSKERIITWETARTKEQHICRKCSISKEKNPNFGKHRTEETKKKIRLGNITKGWRLQGGGYKAILVEDHPRAKPYKGGRYIMEHILVMEEYLGRFLEPREIIHHIDGNKRNNKIENLFLCSGKTKKESKQIHHRCHQSAQDLIYQMLITGGIKFNKEAGKYEFDDQDKAL